jgi:hypothetical protein
MFGGGKSFLPDHFDHPALVRIDDVSAKKAKPAPECRSTGRRFADHSTRAGASGKNGRTKRAD